MVELDIMGLVFAEAKPWSEKVLCREEDRRRVSHSSVFSIDMPPTHPSDFNLPSLSSLFSHDRTW
jgi:hypothetical protein